MSTSYVGEIAWDLGEERHVRASVKSRCGSDVEFVVRNARWELVKSNSIESQGECSVNHRVLDAIIAPQEAGTYTLRLIYEVADETWVDNIKVRVN